MPGMYAIGPFSGAGQIVGSASLPSSPTFRQIYVTPAGLYICLLDGSWTLLSSGSASGKQGRTWQRSCGRTRSPARTTCHHARRG